MPAESGGVFSSLYFSSISVSWVQIIASGLILPIHLKGLKINMKATGIVRRIDDLGRVVIPKEIRRTMRIREGDPLQMTLTDTERQLAFATALVALRDRIGATE